MAKKKNCAALLLALCLLTGCGAQSAPAPEAAETAAQSTAPETSGQAADTSRVATAADMAAPVELDLEGLEPVAADEIRQGSYEVVVDSSSSMFKVKRCELRKLEDGSMVAYLTMNGTGYQYLCAATAEEAAQSPHEAYIAYTENAEGERTFPFPVWGLDMPMPCAAFSEKKQMWYDRTLVFRSDSLPLDAFQSVTTAETLGLADGKYDVDVTLAGGSGRANILSPCWLRVENGAATAQIIWSSANYDYMIVDGVRYDAEIGDGHSRFEIPVAAFDRPLAVVADTTAMSQPHEIDYALTFKSDSISKVS